MDAGRTSNSQLQSIISLEDYAAIAESAAASRLARELAHATRKLLPRFDLGCWARYQLGGGAASLHYQIYHVELLRRLAATHSAPIMATNVPPLAAVSALVRHR